MTSRRRHHKSTPNAQYNIHCKVCNETFTRQDAQTGKVIKINEEMFHFWCFKCVTCNRSLGVSCCYQVSSIGNFRCTDCYRVTTAPICHGCEKPTFEKCISAFDVHWHETCFKCRGCNKPFKRHEYVVHEGSAYDEDCYYRHIEGIVTPHRGEIRE